CGRFAGAAIFLRRRRPSRDQSRECRRLPTIARLDPTVIRRSSPTGGGSHVTFPSLSPLYLRQGGTDELPPTNVQSGSCWRRGSTPRERATRRPCSAS